MKFPKNIAILLCTILSTHVFCMRMTEAGKQRAKKSLQQIQKPAQEQKLKPVVFYEPKTKRMSLYFAENNQLKNTLIAPTQVSSYNFSPQKKCLIFQTTISNIGKPEASWTEALKTKALEKITGYKIGEKINSANITKIVDLQTLTEIGSFDGDLITYQFSPNETTILISRRHLGKKFSNEGALKLGARPENDTTRYELFDFASQSTLKTFENVQTIDYTNQDNLIVQYDDETTKEISIQKSSSIFSRFTSPISEKIVDAQDISQKITYYDATKELFVTLPHREKIRVENITAYALSPLKNYLVIQKEQTLYLLNMKTGKSNLIGTNIITYEFSPDHKETRLIVLGAPREYFTGENIMYSLVDTEKPSTSLATFTIDNAFYFKSPHTLIVVNKDNKFTPYNAQTGISFEKEQQQKKQQITQEIRTQERRKEEQKKRLELEQLQQKIQKQKEEQKDSQPQQPSYWQRAKEYFWPTQPAEKEESHNEEKEYLKRAEKPQEETIEIIEEPQQSIYPESTTQAISTSEPIPLYPESTNQAISTSEPIQPIQAEGAKVKTPIKEKTMQIRTPQKPKASKSKKPSVPQKQTTKLIGK